MASPITKANSLAPVRCGSSRRRSLVLLASAICTAFIARPHAQNLTAAESVRDSVGYLRAAMDQFHNRFPVYDDVSSAGNHFHAYAKIPDENAPVTINGSWSANPHSGATAIRAEFAASAEFGGFYFQNGVLDAMATTPVPNFGDVDNAGVNLTGATALTFWARGQRGGERIEFFVGGVGRDPDTGQPTSQFPDSSARRPAKGTSFTLSTSWQPFSISLTGMDLSYVLGGFGWLASRTLNPTGAVFFLDDIQFDLSSARAAQRLNEPRFIASFTMLPRQPTGSDPVQIDFIMRNAAFTYDNALALLAFLAEGSADSLRRARLIGDALVYATQHDRFFNDNRSCLAAQTPDLVNGARLRSAYAAGDLVLPNGWTPRGRAGVVPTPGYYVEASQAFHELEEFGTVDTGNNAWAMLALMSLYTRTQVAPYLETACKLGKLVTGYRQPVGLYQGFLGGVERVETTQTRRPWASSEHNLDLVAAFTRLGQLTGQSQWPPLAEHARTFLEAMWEEARGCYLTGTEHSNVRNVSVLPLDAQTWSVQAVPTTLTLHPRVLVCAETNHVASADGAVGFDFNTDRDGVWFEGTGQAAVSYALAGRARDAETVRRELRRVQDTTTFGGLGGIVAASRDGLTTGFPFRYYKRLHTGATAWNVFAQTGFNPFYDAAQPPPLPPENLAATVAGQVVRLSWNAAAGATSYMLEAGSASGLRDVFAANIGNAVSLSAPAPPGVYYLRIRSMNGAAVGLASDEVVLNVAQCPAAPSGLSYTLQGAQLMLAWGTAAGADTYLLQAGTTPGASNLFNANVGAVTSIGGLVSSGVYFVRVRGVNACGAGPASPELDITVPCAALTAPTDLAANVTNGTVSVQWSPSAGATSYVVEAGITPSVNNLFIGDVGASPLVSASGVPAGSYSVRVRSKSACGVSLPSSPIVIAVP